MSTIPPSAQSRETHRRDAEQAGSVLVIGAGIAGTVAAIEAARAGTRVTIACAGRLFGGSSFYPGTWGLGLIGPVDATDENDLIETILEVGCGVADPALVEVLVRGVRPAIMWLERDLGVELARPSSEDSAGEAAFIPCFDHKHRLWRGITREEFARAVGAQIERLGITVLERCELMGLLDTGGELMGACDGYSGAPVERALFDTDAGAGSNDHPGVDTRPGTGARFPAGPRPHNSLRRVGGALLFDHTAGEFFALPAEAVVLAAGGTSGLFERSLTSVDVPSSVHGLALDAGCTLTNIEFMQMMPGLVAPRRGLVFNEKTFRYARLRDTHGLLPSSARSLCDLLETRSGHGPFTARLGDEAVDLAIDAAGSEGIALTYDFPTRNVPEFVQTFASWLEREHGISPHDELRVAVYAHASNGGIRIDASGGTGVPGLFACGEVTGGMHGADRIGGLSSANGLVFGRRAGKSAAACALKRKANGPAHRGTPPAGNRALDDIQPSAPCLTPERSRELIARLKHLMSTYALINRTDTGLADALRLVDELADELAREPLAPPQWATPRPDTAPDPGISSAPGGSPASGTVARPSASAAPNTARGDRAGKARALRLHSQLALARAMLTAMRNRTESLGSHFRADSTNLRGTHAQHP